MCNIFRSVGSLTTIKDHLQRNYVTGFASVHELIAFQQGYLAAQQEIIRENEISILQEQKDLNAEISQLDQFIKKRKSALEEDLRNEISELKRQLILLFASSGSAIRKLLYF